jgi:hypothetical protein
MDEYREFTENYLGQLSNLMGLMKSTFLDYFYQTELEIIPKLREANESFEALRERKIYEEKDEPDVIEAYSHCLTIGNNMEAIYSMLSNYDIYKNKSSMSLTHILSVAEKLSQFSTVNAEYKMLRFCVDLYSKAKKFIIAMNVHAAHQLYVRNRVILPLYLYYIEKKVDAKLDPKDRLALERNLEIVKNDAILLDALQMQTAMRTESAMQAPKLGEYRRELIQRFDLFPTIQQTTLSKILTIVSRNTINKEVDLDAFISEVQKLNIGLVIIKLDNHSNLEFSISHMLEKGKKLPQSMCNEILDYYSIYKVFKNDPANTPADPVDDLGKSVDDLGKSSTMHHYAFLDGKMYVIGNEDDPPPGWIIIRTIGGNMYNVMSKRAVLDGKMPSIFMPKSTIDKLIRGASSRIECYNFISNSIVPKCIVKPMGEEVDAEIEAMSSDMSNVRKLLILRLDKYIYDSIASIKPKNVYEAATIIDRDRVHNILMDSLMSLTEAAEVEIVITWMAAINARTFKFMKIILDEFAKSKLSDKLFKERNAESSAAFLYALFKRIINVAAEKTIPDGDDIYKNAIRKKILINKKL